MYTRCHQMYTRCHQMLTLTRACFLSLALANIARACVSCSRSLTLDLFLVCARSLLIGHAPSRSHTRSLVLAHSLLCLLPLTLACSLFLAQAPSRLHLLSCSCSLSFSLWLPHALSHSHLIALAHAKRPLARFLPFPLALSRSHTLTFSLARIHLLLQNLFCLRMHPI